MDRRARQRALIRLVSRAVGSGLRRYPREIARSLNRRVNSDAGFPPREAAGLKHLGDYPLASVWLGHAGVLLRQAATTVLVDPVLSRRIGLRVAGRVFGPQRLAPVPVAPGALPEVDLVLITHAHYDHLDRPTLEAIASDRTTVITARGTRGLIPRGYRRVIELDWEQSIELDRLAVTAIRPRHWGARFAVDRRRGFNSYLIDSNCWRTLAAGDTAETDAYTRLGSADLVVFGIGAYDPWIHQHADPEQVWSMFTSMPGRFLLPVHHSTFELSDEHIDEPMRRLLRAAGERASQVIRPSPGEVWVPPGLPS